MKLKQIDTGQSYLLIENVVHILYIIGGKYCLKTLTCKKVLISFLSLSVIKKE